MNGVSIVIPAYNAAGTIGKCLTAASNLRWLGDIEIIVINDGSSDRTGGIAASFEKVKAVNVSNGGAARATNLGIGMARYDTVVSLDADAELDTDWLERIIPSFNEPEVGAVAGYAITGNRTIVGKLMGYDVELRLNSESHYTDHLYTMNTAYSRRVLQEIGMFDEAIRIGYDVDISRRLVAAGYKLVLRKDAKCVHYWRDDLRGYLKQQYDYAYYRLEITRKYKKSHDQFATIGTIMHVPFTAGVVLAAIFGSVVWPFAPLLFMLLPLAHVPKMAKLLLMKKEACILALPFLFTLRNFAWTQAAAMWVLRRALRKLRRK